MKDFRLICHLTIFSRALKNFELFWINKKRGKMVKRELCWRFYSHIKQTVWTSQHILKILDFRPECSKICQDLCSFYVKQSLIPECNNSLLHSELPFTSKPVCWMFFIQKTLCVWRYTPPYGTQQNVQIPRFPSAHCWYFETQTPTVGSQEFWEFAGVMFWNNTIRECILLTTK